jgi:LPS sulfotransferase NodH
LSLSPPHKGYVICSEHRSGSTFLCQLLRSTQVLGNSREYFRDPALALRIERDPAELDALVEQASTPNGVYGIKIFTYQFDVTMKSRWPERLPALHWIYLQRRDLLGQAISYVRTLQTGQYLSAEPVRGEPRYDAVAISRHLARLADDEVRWRRYFARNGLPILWLTYEQVAADPVAAVAAVAAHIGEPAVEPYLAQVNMTVQRDDISEEWRARFIADAGDVNVLDHPRGQARVALRRLARDLRHLWRTPWQNR